MFNNTLVTNEIKNAAGTEKEFQRISTGDGRATFAFIGESPAYPHRFTIAHQEVGSGINQRRKSVLRFDKTEAGAVNANFSYKNGIWIVVDRGIGQETTDVNIKDLLANMMSLLATTGAGTTVLFDCTGTGASNLISRGI